MERNNEYKFASSPITTWISDTITELLANDFALSLVCLFISGYIFLILTARQTPIWKKPTTSTERYLIATGIGASFELVIYFFLIASFTTFFHQVFDYSYVYYLSVVFTILLLVVLPLALWANKDSISDSIARKTFSIILELFVAFEIATIITFVVLTVSSLFFSMEVRGFIFSNYESDLGSWYFAFFFALVLSILYTSLYYKKLPIYKISDDFEPKSRITKKITRFHLSSITDPSSISRRKLMIVLVLPIVIITPITFADHEFAIFTPSVSHQTSVHLLPNITGGTPITFEINLMTNGNLPVNSTGPCIMNVYEQESENVTIHVPVSTFLSLNNLTITNPSKISTIETNSPPNYYYSTQPSIWQLLRITNPDHTQITYKPSMSNAQQLEVGIANSSHPSSAVIGLVYSNQVANIPITCTETISRMFETNGSVIGEHIFKLKNSYTFTLLKSLDSIEQTI